MPIKLLIPSYSRDRTIYYTISDVMLRDFIAAPTAFNLDELITFIATQPDEELRAYSPEKTTLAKLLIQGFIKQALKKPREQQDYMVALLQALSSQTDSAQIDENFSTLSDCLPLLKLLKTETYQPHKQFFLQTISLDKLIRFSQTANETEIIDLLQLLPAEQQEQYLESLGQERLREVIKDGFTLHGVMDLLKNPETKVVLRNLLGIDHLRGIIAGFPDSDSYTLEEKIQNLVALLRAAKSDDDNDPLDQLRASKSNDDYNATLEQLGTDFLLTILVDTKHLGYFFQQINTYRQGLVLNMLGAENLKKILMKGHTVEELAASEIVCDNTTTARNIFDLMSNLHPANHSILLNLLGQNWFDEIELEEPLTDLFPSKNREVITALLPFIITPQNIDFLAGFAFNYGDGNIGIHESTLVENLPSTDLQPYNLSGDLPLVTLLWRSLKSEDSKKWITENHALLNDHLVRNLYGRKVETTPAVQKYYLSALAHDGILAACITNSFELANVLHQLCKDVQITFLESLGADQLQNLVTNGSELADVLRYVDKDAHFTFLESLGADQLQKLVTNGSELSDILMYLHKDAQSTFLKSLGADQLKKLVTNGSKLTNVLKNLHEDLQITFLQSLGSDQLQKLIHNWALLGRGALAYLDVEAQNCLLELLGQEHVALLLTNDTQREQVASYLHADNQHRLTDMLNSSVFWKYVKIAGVALAAVAGLGLFAFVAIPGAATVISAWAVSIATGVQSLVSTVAAYSLYAAKYAMTLCYGLLQTAWINIQAYQGLIFISALLTGIAGLVYTWFNKDSKSAVATKEPVELPATFEHIILEEARAKPRAHLRVKLAHAATQPIEPSFAQSAETSLQRRRATDVQHSVQYLPSVRRCAHYYRGSGLGIPPIRDFRPFERTSSEPYLPPLQRRGHDYRGFGLLGLGLQPTRGSRPFERTSTTSTTFAKK